MFTATLRQKPSVYVTARDFGRLAQLSAPASDPGAALLNEELKRAQIIPENGRRGFAQLGSVVTYLDLAQGRTRTVELVLPGEADETQARVSVRCLLGAALLGLSEGDVFAWTPEAGDGLGVKVLGVGWRDPSFLPSGIRYFRRAPR